jgi:hypothetical protein
MNMNREGNLLTPALSSTSVWRRGRWNGVRGFWGSMREMLRGILSLKEGWRRSKGSVGETPTDAVGTTALPKKSLRSGVRPSQTQSNPVKPQWEVWLRFEQTTVDAKLVPFLAQWLT